MLINESVPGWMTKTELELISQLASTVPSNGLIIEIGSYAGRSAFHWAANSDASVRLVCMDPFTLNKLDPSDRSYLSGDPTLIDQERSLAEVFLHYLAPYQSKVELIRSYSPPAAWDQPADMIFLDGSHLTENVLADLRFWDKRLKPGGRLLGHDIGHDSVRQALEQYGKPWVQHPHTTIWEIETGKSVE